jgi:hypothetical protein
VFNAYLNTKVEIIRDNNKVLDTKACVQESQIYFSDVDIRELDIIRIKSVNLEYRVMSVITQLQGNRVLYKKVLFSKVG